MQRNGEEEENCIFSFFSNFFLISHAGLFILFNKSVIASFKNYIAVLISPIILFNFLIRDFSRDSRIIRGATNVISP